MNPTEKPVSIAGASRRLEIGNDGTRRLIAAGMLEVVSGTKLPKVTVASIEALEARKMVSIPCDVPILRVPKAPEELGASMFFDPTIASNAGYIEEINRKLIESGRDTELFDPARHKDYRFSGFWQVASSNIEYLLAKKGIILSTIAGFVHEGARILSVVDEIDWQRRKVLGVRPLLGEELKPYLGFLPSKAIGPSVIRPEK
ncbi:hypothetical protein ATK23_2548 [Glutamicibacter mysorens]|uniref:Uncharacterized protein n=1 Tax=Glutamicibacter mysorens TaxID=257984 RepID=A0ABX4N2S9_9MICC|nr:hypothetical protein [Glutamicibacter mysorens]PJJ45285.1 hypothetical protein ATK23_2548 [Glutamicibacter mysorens]